MRGSGGGNLSFWISNSKKGRKESFKELLPKEFVIVIKKSHSPINDPHSVPRPFLSIVPHYFRLIGMKK